MPKIAKELTALAVSKLKKNGVHAVGGVPGLYLLIIGKSRSWILRKKIGGKDRWLGLGSCAQVSLATARNTAREMHNQIRSGIDPVEERREAKARAILEVRKNKTFKECAELWINMNRAGWVAAHTMRLEGSLFLYVYPIIGNLPVAAIDTGLVLVVLQQSVATKDGNAPLWEAKTDTATRLRGRLENILNFAKVRGFREGDNPADWRILKHALPAKSKICKEENFPALPYTEIGAFMAELRKRDGIPARALEFSILTAVRSNEVRGAIWKEIDLEARVWIIPAERMKMDKEHRIPLSDAAVRLLESLPRHKGNNRVFPAEKAAELSGMALLKVIQRMHNEKFLSDGRGWIDPKLDNRIITAHGFRSTFSDWAREMTDYEREVREHALAHKLPDKAEAAYARGTQFDKRKGLMAAWARECGAERSVKGDKLVSIRKAV